MFNYTSPINDKKEYSDLIMSEIEPIAKINLRSKKRDLFGILRAQIGWAGRERRIARPSPYAIILLAW